MAASRGVTVGIPGWTRQADISNGASQNQLARLLVHRLTPFQGREVDVLGLVFGLFGWPSQSIEDGFLKDSMH